MPLKVLLYVSLSVLSLFLFAVVVLFIWVQWGEVHLPSEETAREQFANHRTDYVRFASLLREDPDVRFVGSDGTAGSYTTHDRVVPQYRDPCGVRGRSL